MRASVLCRRFFFLLSATVGATKSGKKNASSLKETELQQSYHYIGTEKEKEKKKRKKNREKRQVKSK